MTAADAILTGVAIIALAAIAAVLVGSIWNRMHPRPRPNRTRRVALTGHMRSTSGVLIPVAQARPRQWTVDLGVIYLVVTWNGRDYLVARTAVPTGFADHLRTPAPGASRARA